MKKIILYDLLVIAVLLTSILIFPQLPLNALNISLRLLMILISGAKIVSFFIKYVLYSKINESIKNAGLSSVSFVIALLLLEIVFMFLPRTHGIGYSLANVLWFDRYWKPINSHGNRDAEPIKNIKTNIFFAGDSFTAGHGIKYIKDRFSDIVKANLARTNNDIQVINLAHNSFDTKSEYESLLKFIESSGIQPNFIVLQYYGNDIDRIAGKHGLKGAGEGFSPYAELNFITHRIVNGSYLANFLYWLLPRQDTGGYSVYLEKAYSSQTIYNEHMQELRSFIDFARARDIPLLVIIFPLLQEIELSKKVYIERISNFLASNKVEHIDLSILLKTLPVSERLVNSNDAHPSLDAHRLVGEELTGYISRKISK